MIPITPFHPVHLLIDSPHWSDDTIVEQTVGFSKNGKGSGYGAENQIDSETVS